MDEEMFNLLPRASTYEPTSSFLPQLDKHRQEGVWRSCLWCLGGAHRSILRGDMNILGPKGSLVTKGLMTVARHVL